MEVLELPPNFDKYSNIIKFYKNNGVDCLSSKVERFRFYIVYIYSKKELYLHSSFYEELNKTTNPCSKNYPSWGNWNNSDTDSYDIKKFTFHMPEFGVGFKITDKFLYKEFSLVSDNQIENYFNDLYSYGRLSITEHKIDYITITNTYNKAKIDYITLTNIYNEAKIVVQKELFYKYCGYHKMLEDYKVETFSIDILFSNKVANNISALLNERSYDIKDYKYYELEQHFNIMNFLEITLNFDDIKS